MYYISYSIRNLLVLKYLRVLIGLQMNLLLLKLESQ